MIEKMINVSIRNVTQPIHWHDLLEVDLVLSGEMDVVRNNRTFHIKTGDIIVLNRDDVHTVSSDSGDLLYVQLQFNMQQFNQYIPDVWTMLVYCSPEENDAVQRNLKEEIKSHMGNIVKLMEEQGSNVDAEKKIIYYCIDILNSFRMAFGAFPNVSREERSEEQANRIWKVIDYIYDNCYRKLTLHEVAQQVYVSDDYLTKLLKKYTGRGYEDFIGFVRAELSIRLLLNTEKSISDIAYECGYSAPKYYNAAFEKNYGCKPVEYRRANRANFQIEKRQETANLVFDEGVDRLDAFARIDKVIIDWATDILTKEINININDLQQSGTVLRELKSPQTGKGEILNYNIQRELADVELPCISIGGDVLVWQERDTTKILIINPDRVNQQEYLIQLKNLDPSATYIYCRAKPPQIPPSIRKLANSGTVSILNREIIDNMYNLSYEYGEVTGEEQIYMNVELGEEYLTKIILQKL